MTDVSDHRGTRFDVPCTVEIEHTAESLHAHVELHGEVELRPGDEVLVHDAPTHVPFGQRLVVERRATVMRAGAFERFWTRVLAYWELTELYEVGFSAGRKP